MMRVFLVMGSAANTPKPCTVERLRTILGSFLGRWHLFKSVYQPRPGGAICRTTLCATKLLTAEGRGSTPE